MPFHRGPRPVIKSDKHEITWSNLAQDASSVKSVVLAVGVKSPDQNLASEVEIGSRINSIYFEMNIAAQVITNPKVFHWEILLRPAGLDPAAGTPSLYYQIGRNLVIKRGMEMLPSDVGTVFKRIFVVRIPKKGIRVGEGDVITVRYIVSSSETINFCGFAIYKELK